MRVEQLKQIRVLEERLSISQAAKQLYMTPAALSMSLTNLEDELGIKLFDRLPSGIQPTAEEREISGFIYGILSDLEQLQQLPAQLAAQKDTIILATVPALYDDILLYMSYGVPEKLAIKLTILSENMERIIDCLAVGQCDMAVISCISDQWRDIERQLKAKHLSHELLQSTYFKLCLSPNHPLAAKPFIDCTDITQEKIFLLRDCTLFLQNSYLLDKMSLEQWTIVDDLETLKKLTIAKQGIGIASHFCLMQDPYFEHGLLLLKDLYRSEKISDYLLYNRHRCQTPAKQRAIAQLRQWKSYLSE